MIGGTLPVSVLLPVRDAGATLEAALRSVARQRFRDFECVIVDDGSTDGSLALARQFAQEDPRFRVIESHGGLVVALQRGLEECQGTWVARMDADDLMHRQRLTAQLDLLARSPGLSVVGTHVRLFPRAGLTGGMRGYEAWLDGIESPEDIRRELFVECPLAHPTLMIRRSVLAKFGYRDRNWPEDYDLLLRLVLSGEGVGVVPRRLHSWREGRDRHSRTHPRYARTQFMACKASFLADHHLRTTDRYVLWGYGDTGRALRKALRAHGKSPSHVVELHPGRLGQRIHGAPVIPPAALAGLRGEKLIASVAGPAARREIRTHLAKLGFEELRDFVCAA